MQCVLVFFVFLLLLSETSFICFSHCTLSVPRHGFAFHFGLNFALYTDMQLADVVAVYEKNLRKKKHKLELEMRQQRMVYIWTSQNSENANKFPYIHDCIQAKINSISM